MADCDANELVKKTGENPESQIQGTRALAYIGRKDRDKWCAEIHITQVPGAHAETGNTLYDETEAKVAKKAREYLNKHDKTLPRQRAVW